MDLSKTIRDNLRFLIVEVDSQIENLEAYFRTRNASVAHQILDRSGYSYNLKMRIHNSCEREISGAQASARVKLRAVEVVASELEWITELYRDCIHQMGYLSEKSRLDKKPYIPMLRKVRKGIALIEKALHENSAERALGMGRIERTLDRAYRRLLNKYTRDRGRRRARRTWWPRCLLPTSSSRWVTLC